MKRPCRNPRKLRYALRHPEERKHPGRHDQALALLQQGPPGWERGSRRWRRLVAAMPRGGE